MTGYKWWTGMIIINQSHKLRLLNTLKIFMMMLSSSIRELFLVTWQKKGCELDHAKLASTPTALSSKCAQIVTQPDVEEALRLWVQHMEQKWETVTGAMLIEKCAQFEDALNVPEQERLRSEGWVQKFLWTWVWNVTENEGNSWF